MEGTKPLSNELLENGLNVDTLITENTLDYNNTPADNSEGRFLYLNGCRVVCVILVLFFLQNRVRA